MRTVFFVDDDLLMLQQLRGLIDWHAHGFDIAGQALDGASAVERILLCQPDLVILDVEMPEVNGIAVLEKIRQGSPRTCVLMLSNYDTYSFVRSTLRLGACDYLLKQELSSEKLCDKLTEIQPENEFHSPTGDPLLLMQRRRELLRKALSQEAFSWEETDWNAADFILLEIENFELLGMFEAYQDTAKLINSVTEIIDTLLSAMGRGISLHIFRGYFAVLLFDAPAPSSRQAQDFFTLIRANIRRNLEISIRALQYYSCPKSNDLKRISLRVRREISPDPPCTSLSLEEENRLAVALRFGEAEKIQELLEHCFERWTQYMGNAFDSLAPVLPDATAVLRIGQRFAGEQHLLLPSGEKSVLLNSCRNSLTLLDLKKGILKYFSLISSIWLGAANNDPRSTHVVNAVEYIHSNYSKNISLSTAAAALHVSGEHLSRIFRMETGQTFSQYLTNMRIQIADQLMREKHLKATDVYQCVGFANLNYFLRVYKKITGHTVSERGTE